jgi:hypothetical protein
LVTVYKNSEQLYDSMKLLFSRVTEKDSAAATKFAAARLIIRMRILDHAAEVVINGRKNPPQATYGASSLRPDLDIELKADALHQILLGELPLGKAVGTNQIKLRGPVWKSFVLADLFHDGQDVYPQVLREMGLEAR